MSEVELNTTTAEVLQDERQLLEMATMRKVGGSAPSSANSILSNDSHDEDLRNPRSLDSFIEDAYSHGSTLPAPYWILMFSLGVANSSDASEILCLNYILSDEEFEDSFLGDSPWRAGLLAAAVFWGMLIGGLVVGFLGDLNGRRPMLIMGLVCNSVAGILSACAQDVYQLSIIRAAAGLGIGATVPPLFTLVTELSPPSRRGFFVTFCASFWMVGSIYVALAALLVWEYLGFSWRVFAVLCAAPSALGALLVGTLVPESPRFLAMNGHTEKSLNNANTIALKKLGYEGSAWTMQELLYYYPPRSSYLMSDASRRQQEDCFQTVASGVKEFCSSTSLLYTRHLAPVTWPLQTVWFSLSFGSYGIMTWINSLFVAVHLQNIYFNALLFALANLPGNLLSGFLMDRMGRKPMLILSCLAASASLMLFAWFARQENDGNDNTTDPTTDESSHNAAGIVLSACSFQAFVIAAWNTIDCMTSELFPTAVRSTGMGVCAASGRIGAMVAQFINGALVGNPVRLLLVASISLIIGAATPGFLPVGGDMSQRPLEDSASPSSSSTFSSRARGQDGDLLSEEHTVEDGLLRHDGPADAPLPRVKSTDQSTSPRFT